MRFARLLGLAAACTLVAACNETPPETGKVADVQDIAIGEGKEAALEYRFDNFDNLPEDFATLFKPDDGSPQHYVAYMKDVDRAFFELKQGAFSKAAERFAAIGRQTLFETPNDATWAGHAESLCRAGQKAKGRKQLIEAQCSQQILANKLSCTDLDRRVSEPDFPAACYREYCEAAILRPYFEEPSRVRLTPEDLKRTDDYARHLDKVAGYCR